MAFEYGDISRWITSGRRVWEQELGAGAQSAADAVRREE